jgi:hypothetical protein
MGASDSSLLMYVDSDRPSLCCSGTPADKLLALLYQLADGHMPDAEDIQELQNVLMSAQDIYQVHLPGIPEHVI